MWSSGQDSPALDTVAGVAVRRWLISKTSLIVGFRGILSLLARVSTCTWQTDRQTDRLTPPPRTGTKSIQHFTLKSLVAVSRWFLTNRTILLSSMTNNTPSGWGRKVLDYDPALFLKGLKLWAGFVVTHKPDSPGKENSNGNILWAISFMYHFLYALLFVLSEETQPHYFRGCYCSICISPRLNHNTQSRNIPSLTYLHYLIIIHHSIKRFNPHRINISI